MDKISIIIPIYNVEKYLKRCIDSIINQTYKNIEIILVDDGSEDKCKEIINEYEKKDKRIKSIHKKNGGLSDARNTGIKNSTGQYLFFVDGDDAIEPNLIEYLYEGINKYNVQISCCAIENIYENGKKEISTVPQKDIIYTKKEALDIYLLSGYIGCITCNKMFSKKLFEDINFPVGLLYEDIRTVYKLLEKVDKIVLRPKYKYLYYKRSNSISEKSFSKNTLDLLNACDEAISSILNEYPDLKNIKIARIQWYMVVINKMILSKKVDKFLVKKVKRMIKEMKKYIKNSEFLSKKRKIQIFFFYYSRSLYEILYKILIKIYR